MKEKAIMAGIKYLRTKQMKGKKGINIRYTSLELQDYLDPFSNMALVTWCDKINKETEQRFTDILNGNLEEKIKTLKQIKKNEKRREK